MVNPNIETLDIIIDDYIRNGETGEEYPVLFQDAEKVVFLQPDGTTNYLLKEFMHNAGIPEGDAPG